MDDEEEEEAMSLLPFSRLCHRVSKDFRPVCLSSFCFLFEAAAENTSFLFHLKETKV